MKKLSITNCVPLIVVIASVFASGCGGSSSSATSSSSETSAGATPTTSTAPSSSTTASSTGPQVVKLSADPGGALNYSTTRLTARPGKVTIQFTNSSPIPHNTTVQSGSEGPTLGATPTFSGSTKSITLNLKAGTYAFFCSVPGHRQAGMQGTLTVQ